ncbi:hypothetical protein EPIR_2756 [Erwinia piriflorinigrans CFBP 5888]|uniref:Uncharacterized protein n=1 Tax=Erwinia piriflorinigrans CFBP 5888 TaxID=1161919 RepID=V5ZAZ1_9GAMM|nr:hypothetical protein EPIR_2756 [Erwinia piriflorinigrans CFBP 5888]
MFYNMQLARSSSTLARALITGLTECVTRLKKLWQHVIYGSVYHHVYGDDGDLLCGWLCPLGNE